MALRINKPYVWLDKRGPEPIIRFRIKCSDGFGLNISSGFYEEREEDDTLYVIYKLREGVVTDDEITYILGPSSGSLYRASTHNKVVLVIVRADDSIAGFTSMMPSTGVFDVTPNGAAPELIPYCWLEFIASDDMVAHVAAYLPSSYALIELEYVDDPIKLTRKAGFSIKAGAPGSDKVFHREVFLNETTNFDPAYDTIYLELVEPDGSGGFRKKGTTTVHTSEADASGND